MKEQLEDHSWDNGEVTREPTTAEAGIKTYTCDVCGTTREEEIEPLATEIGGGSMNADNNGSSVNTDQEAESSSMVLIIAIAGVATIGVIVAITLLMRKKKKFV